MNALELHMCNRGSDEGLALGELLLYIRHEVLHLGPNQFGRRGHIKLLVPASNVVLTYTQVACACLASSSAGQEDTVQLQYEFKGYSVHSNLLVSPPGCRNIIEHLFDIVAW